LLLTQLNEICQTNAAKTEERKHQLKEVTTKWEAELTKQFQSGNGDNEHDFMEFEFGV
jgi:hypothetical protein